MFPLLMCRDKQSSDRALVSRRLCYCNGPKLFCIASRSMPSTFAICITKKGESSRKPASNTSSGVTLASCAVCYLGYGQAIQAPSHG